MSKISYGCSVLVAVAASGACAGPTPGPLPATTPALAAPAPVIVEDLATPPGSENSTGDAVEAAVAAPERSEADKQLDQQRKPAELLRFFGIQRGHKLAELGAGGGYTTELLARVVGPEGKVYGQNSQFILDRFAAQPWSARLKKPVMQNTVRLDTPFDAPFPESVRDLDAVLVILFYHDTVWQKVDRAQMNAAVYRALKPGGTYGIVDHSARPGDGLEQTETLHRIDEKQVIAEVEAAGFRLEETADFLRNPADTRDWNASPKSAGERRGASDRFVLKFEKPQSAQAPAQSQ